MDKNNYIIKQSNDLIYSALVNSADKLPSKAIRLHKYMTLIIYNTLLDKYSKNHFLHPEDYIFSFHVDDFLRELGISKETNHKILDEVKTLPNYLINATIQFLDNKGKTLNWYTLYQSIQYNQETGIFTFEVQPFIAGFYAPFDNPEQFKHDYNIKVAVKLKNKYTQALYQYINGIMQHPDKMSEGGVVCDYEYLRVLLDADESSYTTSSSFYQHVLKRAVNEIRKTTTLSFDCSPIMKGNKITAFRFFNITDNEYFMSNKKADDKEAQFYNKASEFGFYGSDVIKLYQAAGGNEHMLIVANQKYQHAIRTSGVSFASKLDFFLAAMVLM